MGDRGLKVFLVFITLKHEGHSDKNRGFGTN